ncbi:hypothetical protein NL676_032290 [Syzygium grande]|nr:hypothetical protein NL676_032290 [Syzygium grande]
MRRRSSAIAKLQAHQSPSSPPAQPVVRTDSPFQFAPKSPSSGNLSAGANWKLNSGGACSRVLVRFFSTDKSIIGGLS